MSLCVHLWIISLCLCAFAPLRETNAQVRPVYDYGALGLGQTLKKLNTTKSVMHIGAHPDDEDSGLLAYLARGENARTAYLSLTRGDGGQNIIGSELFESLGVIRTEELLQARRLDGAEQYFTRAFDYGFSKTLAEAKEKWDEKVILCDAVRAIRAFRPLVVISRFSGTPADGHGQHQFAGYIAPLAVKAAADPAQCQEAGGAWQVRKFYVSQGFRDSKEPTLRVNTGQYDFLLGRSYFEIAMEGRSQHKTQEQGVLELKGDQFSGLNLIESKVPKPEKETSVFDGLDVSISSIAKTENLPKTISAEGIFEIQNLAQRTLREYEPANPQKLLPVLSEMMEKSRSQIMLYSCIDELSTGSGYGTCKKYTDVEKRAFTDVQTSLWRLNNVLAEAFRRAAGIQIEALSSKEIVTVEELFSVAVRVFVPKNLNAKVQFILLQDYYGFSAEKTNEPSQNVPSFRRENPTASAYFNTKFNVVWRNFATQPYWLKKPREGNMFNAENAYGNQIMPFEEKIGKALVTIEIDGKQYGFSQPVEYRYADDIRGELRRELNVVPKISVGFERNLLVIPQNEQSNARKITLNIENNSSSPVSGNVKLNAPFDKWVAPDSFSFNLKNKGEKTSVAFDLQIPANVKIEDFDIGATAIAGDETFTQTMNIIAYPHIQTHRFYTPAKAKIKVVDLKTAPVKIGYIAGSGDRVFEAIKQMNFDVQMLSENDLTNGDLSRYDAVVVGIRASQVRPDFVANHQRLLDYARNGGTLIVQYQLPVYQNLLPFPAQMGARVTDENAKVTILDPTNPVFNFPNKITDEDFKGWVQERNLYAFSTFDASYKPLLESHDAGEAENKGGLVVAEIGKGKFIYCSYAFFRQLPAGVPGAYRLFANLLSLPKAKK